MRALKKTQTNVMPRESVKPRIPQQALLGLATILGMALIAFFFQEWLFGARKDREFQQTYKDAAIFFADENHVLLDHYSKMLQKELANYGYTVSQSKYPHRVLSNPKQWSSIWNNPLLIKEKAFQTHIEKLVLAQVSRAAFKNPSAAEPNTMRCEMQATIKVFLTQHGTLLESYTFATTQSGADNEQARKASFDAVIEELESKLAEVLGS